MIDRERLAAIAAALRSLSEAVGEIYEVVSDLPARQVAEPWRLREPTAGE